MTTVKALLRMRESQKRSLQKRLANRGSTECSLAGCSKRAWGLNRYCSGHEAQRQRSGSWWHKGYKAGVLRQFRAEARERLAAGNYEAAYAALTRLLDQRSKVIPAWNSRGYKRREIVASAWSLIGRKRDKGRWGWPQLNLTREILVRCVCVEIAREKLGGPRDKFFKHTQLGKQVQYLVHTKPTKDYLGQTRRGSPRLKGLVLRMVGEDLEKVLDRL